MRKIGKKLRNNRSTAMALERCAQSTEEIQRDADRIEMGGRYRSIRTLQMRS